MTTRPTASELLPELRDGNAPTSVYVARSASGIVLYVGITGSRIRRLYAHAKASEWWSLAASVELIHLPTRRDAEELEATLIPELGARFNVQHGPYRKHDQEAVEVPDPELLDIDALTREIGLPRGAAKTLFRSLPQVQRGRSGYVRRDDVSRYIDERTHPPRLVPA